MPWNINDGKVGWANYIDVGAEIGLWKGASLNVDAIATYEYHNPVLDDLQYFSNITIGSNRAFRLMQLELAQKFGSHWIVSLGLRNIDVDYFTSPYTSLFTGTSHTSIPTLSGNFTVATAPIAALGLHLEYTPIENLTIKETLYNGVADDRLNRQFRFCPKGDGILNTLSIHYADNEHFDYSLGSIMENKPSFNYALWLIAEQQLFHISKCPVGLLLQGSIAPKPESYCTHYWGAGINCKEIGNMEAQVGVAVNRMIVADGRETDVELTASLPVWDYLTLQPALHWINTCGKHHAAALIRASFEFGN